MFKMNTLNLITVYSLLISSPSASTIERDESSLSLTSSAKALSDSANSDEETTIDTELFTISGENISAPDDVYDRILQSKHIMTSAVIIDVDGTITNEEDPSKLKGKKATIRGDAIHKIRTLIHAGATVIFCSAWNKIEEIKQRLIDVGFEENDFKINEKLLTTQNKSYSIPNNPLALIYSQYGRILSVKHTLTPNLYYIPSFPNPFSQHRPIGKIYVSSSDPYYRAKAFSAYLMRKENPNLNIQEYTEVHILDDSNSNRLIAEGDLKNFNLYPGTSVYIYEIKTSREIKNS